jgi:hypothetical protein
MDERTKQIISLEKKLSDAAAAQEFDTLESGKLAVEYCQQIISFYTKKILSDEYQDNHIAYREAVSKVKFAAGFLNMISGKKDAGDAEEKLALAKGE